MSFSSEMSLLQSTPILLLELAFPSGTKYYSSIPAAFAGQFYSGDIMRVGSVRRSVNQSLGLFEVSSLEAIFQDTLGTLLKLSDTDQIKGVVLTMKFGTSALALSNFQTLFTAKIDDFSAGEYSFRVLTRDRFWTMPKQPTTGFVDDTNFPNALPAHKGMPLPFWYGILSDTDTNDARNRGAVPTLYVDTSSTNKKFLVAAHAVKSIDQVYVYTPGNGSVLLTLGSDYTVQLAGTLAGQTMAWIAVTDAHFSSTFVDSAGNLGVVTANIHGKDTNNDSTGTTIQNPVDILEDVLTNYLGNPTRNSTMFSAAETVATNRAYAGAGGYSKVKNTDQFIKELCDSFGMRLFPDKNGQIGIDIFDPVSAASVTTKIREQWEILENSYAIDFLSNIQSADDAQIINSADYQFSYNWAKEHYRTTNSYTNSTSISKYGTKHFILQFPWLTNSAVALEIAGRYVEIFKEPVASVSCDIPLLGLNMELTDPVLITHGTGPFSGGYSDRLFEIIEHTFDPTRMVVHLRMRDIAEISDGAYFMDDENSRLRQNDGTIQVTNGSQSIVFSGATSLITSGVQVGDIIRIVSTTHEANRLSLKITEVTDSTHIKTAQTVWTNESNITYEIVPSWITAGTTQKTHGHLCDTSTGEFSNNDPGFELL